LANNGVGARVRRKEDSRFLFGEGQYIGDLGTKGVGEGGAIGPAAAIANAVNDALRHLQVEITEIPITPRRILQALAARGGVN
jgi:hypothetical protein